MKIFAMLSDIAFIILVASLFLGNIGTSNGKDIVLLAIFFALPIVNLAALWMSRERRNVVSLFFERKKLEQEIKIAELRKKVGEDV